MQNETAKSNFETDSSVNSLLAEVSETGELSLVVPLSAARLDLPFDYDDGEEVASVVASTEEISGAKNTRVGKSSKLETTDQATAGLTLPLRAKLLLVFGGIAVLFVISFASAAFLLFGLVGQGKSSINQQLRSDRVHQMQMAFLGEQGAINRLILQSQSIESNRTDLSDFEYQLYNITFENNLFLLRQEPDIYPLIPILDDLEQRHFAVATKFQQTIRDLKSGAEDKAVKRWQETEVLYQDLIARLINFAEYQNKIADASRSSLERDQNQVLIGIGLIIGSTLLMLVFLIWLANRFVVGPMGRLNVKLGHLLYSQTARITDRLNMLEHEIESQFQKVAAARHDLKLPLSNIRNAAEIVLITEPDLPPYVRENLEEITEITDSSAALIGSLLGRNGSRLQLKQVDLSLLIRRVVELVDLREYNVNTRIELTEAVLDPELIEHVLLNLLSNARKFSSGGIGIGARLVPYQWGQEPFKKEGEDEIELWVWNDGPVIAAHERALIFRPGGQTAIGKQAGGHGIGLSIVKSIIERHGGRVVVESHEKVGTTFRVFLPYLSSSYNGDETD